MSVEKNGRANEGFPNLLTPSTRYTEHRLLFAQRADDWLRRAVLRRRFMVRWVVFEVGDARGGGGALAGAAGAAGTYSVVTDRRPTITTEGQGRQGVRMGLASHGGSMGHPCLSAAGASTRAWLRRGTAQYFDGYPLRPPWSPSRQWQLMTSQVFLFRTEYLAAWRKTSPRFTLI